MAGSTADIGIRVFLDDAASQALFAIDSQLGQVGILARRAGVGVGMLSASMAALAVVAGLAISFGLFAFALKFSVDQALALQTSMFGLAVAFHVPMSAATAFTNTLMNLAAGSIFTTADIATGMGILGRAGFSLQAVMGATADGMHGMAAAGVALSIAIRTDVVSGFNLLSQVMSAQHMSANQAMATADLLQFAFEHQTSSVSQFSAALAQVTPFAYKFGVPLREILSALDTLGPQMKNTSTAGTALRYTLAGLYSPTAGARAEMVKLGLGAVDAAGNFHSAFYNAKGVAVDFGTALLILQGKLKGLTQEEQAAALHAIFSVKGGQGADAMVASLNKYILGLKKLDASNQNSGGAMKRWEEIMATGAGAVSALQKSITDLGAAIGTPLLPMLTQAATWLNGVVSAVRATVLANPTAAAKFLLLGLAISGIGLMIALAMTPIGGFIVIILLVVAAVIALAAFLPRIIAGFQAWVAGSAPAKQALALIGQALGILGGTIKGMAEFLLPQLGAAWTQIKAALAPLVPYIPQIKMFFQGLAMVLGGILLTAILVVIAVVAGLAHGLAWFIAGVVTAFAGFVGVIIGFVNLIHSVMLIIQGVFTGNSSMIQSGFRQMGTAIVLIVTSFWGIIKGIFIATIGAIFAFVGAFVQTIITFFQHLSSTLVGHSIIPDMMNSIRNAIMAGLAAALAFVVNFVVGAIARFIAFAVGVGNAINNARAILVGVASVMMAQLGSAISSGVARAVSFFQSLPGKITGALSGLAGQLWNWGANAMSQFAAGLWSGIGKVTAAVANAAGQVGNFLRHLSPAKMGPLANDDTWMPNMMKMFASGIDAHAPLLTSAMARAAGGIASVPGMSRMSVPSTLSGLGGMAGGNTTVQLVMDGRITAEVVLNRITGHMQMNGMGRAFR
jgi:TP901 family phage tail tape measure protein